MFVVKSSEFHIFATLGSGEVETSKRLTLTAVSDLDVPDGVSFGCCLTRGEEEAGEAGGEEAVHCDWQTCDR